MQDKENVGRQISKGKRSYLAFGAFIGSSYFYGSGFAHHGVHSHLGYVHHHPKNNFNFAFLRDFVFLRLLENFRNNFLLINSILFFTCVT